MEQKYQKFTKKLLQRIKQINDDEAIEVLLRLKDPRGLERVSRHRVEEMPTMIEEEIQYSHNLMSALTAFIHNIEEQGENIEILDTSWLTNSILVVASPSVLKALAERDDIYSLRVIL